MCGFVGMVGVEPVAPSLYLGLQAVQHRGQDACGMGTYRDGALRVYKDLGKVGDVFEESVLATLPGTSGIGHVRYPTVGSSTRNDAQPFFTQRPAIILAHNGNITNLEQVYAHLRSRGIRAMSTCDAEPILLVLADELLQRKVVDHTEDDLVIAIRRTMEVLRGSYSVVAVMEVSGQETLVAFRDPHGIRPAVYGGRADGAWMAASESVSLDVLDFQRVADVPPGSVVFLRKNQPPVVREVLRREPRHCIFEDIYFARPDSVMAGTRVNTRRWQLGQRLADEWSQRRTGAEGGSAPLDIPRQGHTPGPQGRTGTKGGSAPLDIPRQGHAPGPQGTTGAEGVAAGQALADVIVAVPDTSRPAAQAMSERLGVPFREGFIKNRYSGRTFIMPDQRSRETELRLKLNPIEEIFRGQRVVLVDDSIVRGTTMRRIVQMVRKLEPRELHLAIFSPAVLHPCFYGIDMPTREELVAAQAPQNGLTLEQWLARYFGADSVTFLSEEGMRAVAGESICNACFTGRYVVPVGEGEREHIERDRRPVPAGARAP